MSQHVLPMFCKNKSFWQRFTCTESVDEPENSSAAKTRETDEDDGWEDLSIDDLASLFLNFKTLDKVIYYGVLTTKLLQLY